MGKRDSSYWMGITIVRHWGEEERGLVDGGSVGGGRPMGRGLGSGNFIQLLTNFCQPLNLRPALVESDRKLIEVLPASRSTCGTFKASISQIRSP